MIKETDLTRNNADNLSKSINTLLAGGQVVYGVRKQDGVYFSLLDSESRGNELWGQTMSGLWYHLDAYTVPPEDIPPQIMPDAFTSPGLTPTQDKRSFIVAVCTASVIVALALFTALVVSYLRSLPYPIFP